MAKAWQLRSVGIWCTCEIKSFCVNYLFILCWIRKFSVCRLTVKYPDSRTPGRRTRDSNVSRIIFIRHHKLCYTRQQQIRWFFSISLNYFIKWLLGVDNVSRFVLQTWAAIHFTISPNGSGKKGCGSDNLWYATSILDDPYSDNKLNDVLATHREPFLLQRTHCLRFHQSLPDWSHRFNSSSLFNVYLYPNTALRWVSIFPTQNQTNTKMYYYK